MTNRSDTPYPVRIYLKHAVGRTLAIEACEMLKDCYPIENDTALLLDAVTDAMHKLSEAATKLRQAVDAKKDWDTQPVQQEELALFDLMEGAQDPDSDAGMLQAAEAKRRKWVIG